MLRTDILSARQIGKTLRQKSAIHAAMTADFKPDVWEVWFAWFPVKIAIITRHEVIHDEVLIEGHTKWRWLTTVARRPIRKFTFIQRHRWYPWFQPYDYGPATNSLTQPKALFGRNFLNG